MLGQKLNQLAHLRNNRVLLCHIFTIKKGGKSSALKKFSIRRYYKNQQLQFQC